MSTCTSASAELGESVAATAATARTWLLVEQPGPWGPKALTSSRLDPAVGRELERLADGTGVRVALIRRPGRHADLHLPARHRVFLAHTAPGDSWVRSDTVTDPAELAELDFTALGAGSHGGFGDLHAGPPLVLVCTNGRRDPCCAVQGRPLAAALAAADGPGTWEATHLGGHRFSPTVLVLPFGYAYGRVDTRLAKEVLEAAHSGRVVLDGCRGRSFWDRPGQAADLAVRALTGEDREGALAVSRTVPEGPERWTVRVGHVDGRAWDVDVFRTAAQPPRPESCGGALGTPAAIAAERVSAVSGRS
ncbi:sucrase ferredoxin [Streptomyces sp. NPDC020983]|uniref:sucrase ferredoxin n=1 Tax=Streptomyces sp. NPDC020983 TaxID=3365106 RepID=UPI0037BA8B11